MSYRKSYPNLSFESRLIMMEGDEFDAESDYLNNQYRNQKNYSGIVTPAKISSQGPNGNATSGNPMSRVRLDFPVYPDEAELKEGDQRYVRHDLDPFLNPTGDTGDQDPIQTGAKVNLKSVGNDPAYNGKTNNLRVQFGSVGNSAGLQSLAGASVGIANLNFGGGSPVPPTNYRSRNSPRAPTPAQLSAANSLGVEYQVIQAIEAVESGGNPAAIRFEPHLWHRKYREFGLTDAQRDQMPFTPNAQVPFSKVASETNEAAFDKAMTISPALAVYSTSL